MSQFPSSVSTAVRPLPAGAVIDFCGERAVVIRDYGDDTRLTVDVDGHEERWWWRFEGVSCIVISVPEASVG